MKTYILKEEDWENFIQKEILPLCTVSDNARVYALMGDLGAGKTTFSKKILHTIGIKQHIQSPTFSIINSYDISEPSIRTEIVKRGFEKVFHMDIYRVEDIEELEVLHIDEIFSNPKNIIFIEWADKIKAHIPKNAVWIYFEHDSLETRKVTINDEIPKQVRDDKRFVQGDNFKHE